MNLKKQIRGFVVLFVLGIVTGVLVPLQTVGAASLSASEQDDFIAPRCYALDVVFIIDQSGSMKDNDPLGNRYYGTHYGLDWLANNHLGLCPEAVHRMGVISFGSTVEVSLPLTKIGPHNQQEWDAQRALLRSKIGPKDLRGTDPKLAFEEARKMLDETAPDDYPRKRVIILLTDGAPCVEELGCGTRGDAMNHERYNSEFLKQVRADFGFSEGLRQQENALRAAIQKYGSADRIPDEERNNILGDYPITLADLRQSTYIWVLAMNASEPYTERDKTLFRTISEEHGGKLVNLANNRNEIPLQFNQVLSALSGISPVLLGCGNLAVQPYLAGAQLDFYKIGTDLKVTISYNGKTLIAGQGDQDAFGMTGYSEAGAIESYRFVMPPAGMWEITASDCEGVTGSFIAFNADIRQLEPTATLPHYNVAGSSSDPRYPYYIRYQIVDRSSLNQIVALSNDPNYPLTMVGIITKPDGSTVNVTFKNTEEGIWTGERPLPVDQLGLYQIEVWASAPCVVDEHSQDCPEGKKELFHSKDGTYQVGEVDTFVFKITSPEQDRVIPLHGSLADGLKEQPLDVRLRLTDSAGAPLQARQALEGDLNTAFQATLKVGEQTSQIFLKPDAADGSLFSGQFLEPAQLGRQTITVQLVGGYNNEAYYPASSSVSVEFIRRDPLFRNPVFYRALGVLLALLVLGLIGWQIWERTDPVQGSLTFISPTGQEKSISLSKRRRVVRITQGLAEVGLKKLVARKGKLSAGRQMIEVQMWPKKGNVIRRTYMDGGGPLQAVEGWRAQYVWRGASGHSVSGPVPGRKPLRPKSFRTFGRKK